jgi:hypothetical protein
VDHVTAGNFPELSGLPDRVAPRKPDGVEALAALVAEPDSAFAAKKPLLMMFRAPHHALAEADVGWAKMPPARSRTMPTVSSRRTSA